MTAFITKKIPVLLLLILFSAGLQANNYRTEYDNPAAADPDMLAGESATDPNAPVNLETWGDFHRRNQPVVPDDILLEKSCSELDMEISYLIPYTYQYKPDFYDDAYNGAAIWGTAIAPVSAFYLPYSWAVSYQEDTRRTDVFYRIEKLRRAKQIKHCFEERY